MNRPLRSAFLAVVCGLLTASFACISTSSASNCDLLAACCTYSNDPSSCAETATGGNISDSQCLAQLNVYRGQGLCRVDGGTGADASPSADAGGQ